MGNITYKYKQFLPYKPVQQCPAFYTLPVTLLVFFLARGYSHPVSTKALLWYFHAD